MLKGIDISEWQGAVDFTALKGDSDFVIVRSSFGTARADGQFARNRDGLRQAGILRGFYHYAYPNNNSAEAEATFAAQVIGPLQGGEVVALDFEEQYANPVAWCLAFLQKFEQLTGYKPLLYINLALIQAHDWTPVVNNNNGLWLAEWDNNPDGAIPAVPWSVVAMRQYSDKITIPGAPGAIDGDVFYGDTNVFEAYGFKETPATAGGGNMYKGLDLTNTASVEVAVDTWYDVVHGAYVPVADVNAVCQILGIPSGSTKDAIIAKIHEVQAAKTIAETTVGVLNLQLPTLKTQNEQLKGQVETLTAANQNTQGQSYKDLYTQAENDLDQERKKVGTLQETYNRAKAQYQNTSYLLTQTGVLFKEILKRVFHLK